MNNKIFNINPGKLNKKVKIFNQANISDKAGGYENQLEEVCEIWASIITLSGKDLWEAQKLNADISHKLIIRNRKDIKKSQIIKYKNKIFDILYLLNANDKETYLEVMVKERLQ